MLRETVEALRVGKPKLVGPRSLDRPVIVLTDGACEPEHTSIGGVLVCDGVVEVFGAVVPTELVNSWKTRDDQEQVIGQAELFPLLISRLTWSKYLSGRRVIYFVDNESARLAMIKAYSPVGASLDLICKALQWDNAHDSYPWFARVPTASNISDSPSRMRLSQELIELGAKVVAPVFPEGYAADSVL